MTEFAAKRARTDSAPTNPPLAVSKRVLATDKPCIVTMQQMMRGKEGLLSLAQGVVHWAPPAGAVTAVSSAASEAATSSYGDDQGMPALREALLRKLQEENALQDVDVMVTAGGNQAYVNIVLTLLDAGDAAVLFEPFYFNHRMALQMTGSADNVVLGRSTVDFLPDVDWLAQRLKDSEQQRIRMVTVVNPGNPTGVMIPREILQRISDLCRDANIWLIIDNTYEYFSYEKEGAPAHCTIGGDHIINVFSFSKAYGMMGWRVGYLAFPPRLKDSLLKVQDTIPICPPQASQLAALAALKDGRAWVKDHVATLDAQKSIVKRAVEETLGTASLRGGSGAIYLMVSLPASYRDDLAVVQWLAEKHKVCVIPGSACGAPGCIRLSYANNKVEKCEEAATRLRAGLQELASGTATL